MLSKKWGKSKMPKIVNIKGYEIIDSRGNPAVKAQVYLDNGKSADAGVPSGASKGTHEALELRDNDLKRYHGQGVLKAIDAIENIIAPKLKGLSPAKQKQIDELMIELDGTENKNKLGANSILAVSLACARAAAFTSHKHLFEYLGELLGNKINTFTPTPMFNIINGGLHGCGTFNFQEFLIIPSSGLPFDDALRLACEVYQNLKKYLIRKNLIYSVGDEGGFTPEFSTNEEVLDAIIETIKESNYTHGRDVYVGMDLAATSFYKDNNYKLTKTGRNFAKEEYMSYLVNLAKKYNLFSLEDSLHEDDWDGWSSLTQQLGEEIIIIGDDLLVTNKRRLQEAIAK